METSLIGKALDFGTRECRFEPYVSNLVLKSSTRVLSSYNISVKKKKPIKLNNLNKGALRFLKKLYKLGILNSFSFNTLKRTARTHPAYYNGMPYVSNLRPLAAKTSTFTISLGGLSLLKKYSGLSIVLIQSNKGIMTIHESINTKTSGSLFAVAS